MYPQPNPPVVLDAESLKAGEPSKNSGLYSIAWGEFIELQVMDKDTWLKNLRATIESSPRWEISATVDGKVVGGIILVNDDDVHVGPCLSVVAQYVLPEYRHRGISLHCMRIAMRTAKVFNHKVLAYSHRLGDWRYETIYRRVK